MLLLQEDLLILTDLLEKLPVVGFPLLDGVVLFEVWDTPFKQFLDEVVPLIVRQGKLAVGSDPLEVQVLLLLLADTDPGLNMAKKSLVELRLGKPPFLVVGLQINAIELVQVLNDPFVYLEDQ